MDVHVTPILVKVGGSHPAQCPSTVSLDPRLGVSPAETSLLSRDLGIQLRHLWVTQRCPKPNMSTGELIILSSPSLFSPGPHLSERHS